MDDVPESGHRPEAGCEPPRGQADPHEGHDHGNCGEALAELYTFLDGELTDQRRIQIAHHLDDCSPCLEVYDFEAELRMVIRQRCREQVPDTLRQQVADRLSKALANEPGESLGLSHPAPPGTTGADPGVSA
jgi:mycothiol system anti-sigma-R factor